MKHANTDVCPSCEAKLKEAHPDLVSWYRNVVKSIFPDAHISWAFRGKADQMREFKEKRSQTPWPKSKHNRTTPEGAPCAEALDLFRLVNGKADFGLKFYRELWAHTVSCNEPIAWGGNFKTLKDYCHYERKAK